VSFVCFVVSSDPRNTMPENIQSLEDSPLVAVIVTTFNSERYLAEALESVLEQTYRNIEVLVVDNRSTDRTVEIVRAYGERVRLHVAAQPCLLAEARNEGVKLTRGDYVCFLDSDDAWYPDKVLRQVEFMEAHPDTPLCHTYCHVMDGQSNVEYVRHEGTLPPSGRCFSELLRHNFITISSVMVRRSVFENDGYWFPCDPRRDTTGEDNLFLLLVARRYPIGLVPEVLAKYRRYGDSACDRLGWKHRPENVPVHRNILLSPVYWQGVASRSEVLAALVDACASNSIFWRDRGFWWRPMFFALYALRYAPLHVGLWRELVKSTFKPLVGKKATASAKNS
jgi:glycosyltransferase involved in cell wall biosynthesis